MANPSQVMEATEGFVCDIDGERFIINRRMTRVAASHPVVVHYPEHFRPVEDNLSFRTEEATANPGEVRDRPPVPEPEAEVIPAPVEEVAPPTTTSKSSRKGS